MPIGRPSHPRNFTARNGCKDEQETRSLLAVGPGALLRERQKSLKTPAAGAPTKPPRTYIKDDAEVLGIFAEIRLALGE